MATRAVVSSDRSPLSTLCAWAAALLPMAWAVGRLDGAERWQHDVAVVRALGLVQVGGEGVLSGALGAGISLLPLGGVLLRLALLSVPLLGLAGVLSYHVAQRALGEHFSAGPRALLALAGSLAAQLGLVWQQAGSAVGGPILAAVLILAWWLWLPRRGDTRVWLGHGLFLGALLLEAPGALAGCALVLALHCAGTLQLPSLGQLSIALGGLLATAAVGLLPSLLESGASGAGALGLEQMLPATSEQAHVLALPTELSVYLGALACVGLLGAVREPARRVPALLAAVWVALGALVQQPALQLVALAALGVLVSAGLGSALHGWYLLQLPLKTPTRALLGFVHLAALMLLAEGAHSPGATAQALATRQWSEEAFERLPARSLLLVSSADAAWRLWASRLTFGLRPDVVVVPTALLAERGVSAQLLELEPKLAGLMRDEAAQGVPSEYALTELADVRPLRVEVDADWDRSLLRHLQADGLWFRFAAHAPGSTDRAQTLPSALDAFRRVSTAARGAHGRDEITLHRAALDLTRHAAVSAALGDRKAAQRILRLVRRAGVDVPEAQVVRTWLREESKARPRTLQQAMHQSDTSSR